jgi:hypothetical protein
MGESKRRKLLDPNYGKRKPLSLGIKVSDQSGNYIVFCQYCDYWIDSATEYNDAILVKNAVEEIAKNNPVKQYTKKHWHDWMKLNHNNLPDVDAKTWVLDTQDLDRRKSALRLLQEGLHPADISDCRETTWQKQKTTFGMS